MAGNNNQALDSGAIPVRQVVGPAGAGIITGQAKIVSTGTRVQFPANAISNGLVIKAKVGNAAPIMIGGSTLTNTYDGTGNGFPLEAGATVTVNVNNTNVIYINGTANDVVSFQGN